MCGFGCRTATTAATTTTTTTDKTITNKTITRRTTRTRTRAAPAPAVGPAPPPVYIYKYKIYGHDWIYLFIYFILSDALPWQNNMPVGWIVLPVYLLIRILQKITLDLDRAICHVILVASGDAYGKLLDWMDLLWSFGRDSETPI